MKQLVWGAAHSYEYLPVWEMEQHFAQRAHNLGLWRDLARAWDIKVN